MNYVVYCLLSAEADPKSYKEASQSEEWASSLKQELYAHKKFGTWLKSDLRRDQMGFSDQTTQNEKGQISGVWIARRVV